MDDVAVEVMMVGFGNVELGKASEVYCIGAEQVLLKILESGVKHLTP